jgi:hypothetical protein
VREALKDKQVGRSKNSSQAANMNIIEQYHQSYAYKKKVTEIERPSRTPSRRLEVSDQANAINLNKSLDYGDFTRKKDEAESSNAQIINNE